jgi:glycosyltransferase involved in cell wall biosynthesis
METGQGNWETVTRDDPLKTSGNPMVSIVVPAYNEAFILEENLAKLCNYMSSILQNHEWELIVVNDGSTDDTGKIAETFAWSRSNVSVLHHFVNFRLGQALRYAFNNCRGNYIIAMDSDLSYSPDHIGRLLEAIKETKAKVVLASPYMEGGKISNVPWLRRLLSVCANRFLSYTAKGKFSTLTGMVRAYDGDFLRALSLRSMDTAINAEILYKAMLLGARIVEIPAHLDWSFQRIPGKSRRSSMRIVKGILSYLLAGFVFRPFMFFILPGFVLMLFSLYPFFWVFMHTLDNLEKVAIPLGSLSVRLSAAVALAFQQSPHTFLIGGTMLMLSIQLISLGVLALQNKNYFEELFHLGSTIYKDNRRNKNE